MKPRPPSPREIAITQADQRMADAKAKFSSAAIACIAGRADAELQVRGALQAVDSARGELRSLSDAEIDGR